MDKFTVALLGLVGGALATGLVQSVLGWVGRRSDSLAAARLVYGQLVSAERLIEAALTWKQFPTGAQRLLEQQVQTWEDQRDRLARVLNVVDFHILQAAFQDLEHIDDVVKQASMAGTPDRGLRQVLADPHHAGREANLAEAERISFKAGLRIRERWLSDRQVKRLLGDSAPAA